MKILLTRGPLITFWVGLVDSFLQIIVIKNGKFSTKKVCSKDDIKMAPLILVVEDEPPLAEMLCYNLEKADFRTVVAFTGEEAIGRAEIEIPDLVVVDWMLPERSGLEVCRILRGKKETRHIPIIMLTARERKETGF